MKKAPIILISGGAILAVALAFWIGRETAGNAAAAHPVVATVKPPETAPAPSGPVKPVDWQEFRNAREATLNANPELASEYKAMLADMDNQQKALEAAMVKADPKVIPIVAKLDLIRKQSPKPPGSPTSAAPAPPSLTQDELTQLRGARLAALKANPGLDTKAKQLAAKMMAFQQKLTAAMVKSDPNLAAVLAKMGPAHPAQPPSPSSPSPAKTE